MAEIPTRRPACEDDQTKGLYQPSTLLWRMTKAVEPSAN